MNDANSEYWSEYTNLQHVKHELIRQYLNGWFPKLGFWSGRIVYLDTHAGRGRHLEGQSGSPMVAIQTLLKHELRDRILEKSEVCFLFIEEDTENVEILQKSVESLDSIPNRIHVDISCNDCFSQLEVLLEDLERQGKQLAPAFVFVDPYGFTVPGMTLRRLLAAGRVEVFINIIWRELDMAIAQAREHEFGGFVDTLDSIFGLGEWRAIDQSEPQDVRADQAVNILQNLYGARWATSIRMLGENRATRYILAHFTNHEAGRDLMKDCMWKVCPDGGFYAKRSDNPAQTRLITPNPDLTELSNWVLGQLSCHSMRWPELSDQIRNELWRKTHLSQVIRELRSQGTITATEYSGRFSEKANPLLSIAGKRP